jgi:hypothetical protein
VSTNFLADQSVSEKLDLSLIVVPAVSILLHAGIRIKIRRFDQTTSAEASNSFKASLDSQVANSSFLILAPRDELWILGMHLAIWVKLAPRGTVGTL